MKLWITSTSTAIINAYVKMGTIRMDTIVDIAILLVKHALDPYQHSAPLATQ